MTIAESAVGISQVGETSVISLESVMIGMRWLIAEQTGTEAKIARLAKTAEVYRRELKGTDPQHVHMTMDEEAAMTAYDLWATEMEMKRRAEGSQAAIAERRAVMDRGMSRLIKAQRAVVVTALRPDLHLIRNIYSGLDHEEAKG